MLRLCSIICLLLVWTGYQPALSQRDSVAVDLVKAIRTAIEVSPEIGAGTAKYDYASARLGLARSSRYLTEFNLTTAHAPVPGLTNPNNTPSGQLFLDPDVRSEYDKLRIFNRVDVELLQPLYTWGELSGSIAAARSGVRLEQAGVDAITREVALRTGELYFNFLLASELSRIVVEAGSIVEQAKTEISTMIDEGNPDVDDADLFQVLITEQEYKRRVIEVDEKLQTAQAALSRQLMLDDRAVVYSEDSLLEPLLTERDSLNFFQELALRNRPEIRQVEAGINARTALLGVARSDLYPKLFIGARFNVRSTAGRFRQDGPFHGDPFTGQSIEAGIGLRQKLNFGQTSAKIRQAQSELNEVDFQRIAAQQLILFEVENAYRNLIIAESALESQNEALRISREWLQLESINFDLDLGDTENLVKAVRANLELQAEAQQSIHAYNIAVLRLYDACGILVSRIRNGTLVE
ncbi:MAG: TolC family protein [Rhodothermales bacterium]|nr:TolC family protein [Rhodothermales bacterium]